MTWFKNYSYEDLERIYLNEMHFYDKVITNSEPTKYDYCRYCYFCILLTQLRNAARLSEATEAIVNYYYDGKTEQFVIVRKRKNKEFRSIIIPKEIDRKKLIYVENLIKDGEIHHKKISSWVKKYFEKNKKMDMNTHTNRHACITHLVLQDINPVDIQGITRHTKLNTIVSYIHQTKGRDILKKLNGVD